MKDKLSKKSSIKLQNLKKTLSDPTSVFIWLIVGLAFRSLWRYFLNIDLLIGNLWMTYAVIEITLHVVISLAVALFIAMSVYKIRYFWKVDRKEWVVWWIGSFFGILVAWCPACSITIASYLWLASIIAALPYSWLELKVIALWLLIYSIIRSLQTLEVCEIKKK